ncbi:DNA polymerase III subunit chi [Sphingomonas sinipercae]|uniref:DNA polymerase III subunit chi n=1 Tax=Sphingomonas sinipercae TaxID=2714944 RepID=A0A6G7ZMN7_9SPHN|nr:DNA polymerase III subunit chi [Sphingomonas sinipercae]QIL02257.1 DNA polymerase III subunit chi [Sphingomonas sinipercae]
MRVDFYQLAGTPVEQVVAALAQKLLDGGERLLIVASGEAALARLDRLLWDFSPTSFLPHGLSGGTDDARQPILLSTTPDAANVARNLLIADGEWREAALNFERAFYLFDAATLDGARLAWKLLTGRGVDRHYWAMEGGRWAEKA